MCSDSVHIGGMRSHSVLKERVCADSVLREGVCSGSCSEKECPLTYVMSREGVTPDSVLRGGVRSDTVLGE